MCVCIITVGLIVIVCCRKELDEMAQAYNDRTRKVLQWYRVEIITCSKQHTYIYIYSTEGH